MHKISAASDGKESLPPELKRITFGPTLIIERAHHDRLKHPKHDYYRLVRKIFSASDGKLFESRKNTKKVQFPKVFIPPTTASDGKLIIGRKNIEELQFRKVHNLPTDFSKENAESKILEQVDAMLKLVKQNFINSKNNTNVAVDRPSICNDVRQNRAQLRMTTVEDSTLHPKHFVKNDGPNRKLYVGSLRCYTNTAVCAPTHTALALGLILSYS